MTDNTRPEALRLAEQYDYGDPATHGNAWKAAVCTELRRQHARIAELEAALFAYASEFEPKSDGDPDVGSIHTNIRTMKAQLASIGAGGVQALSAAQADIAKLRHLYANLKNGGVRDTAQAKRIADGLLAPIIERLEQAATTGAATTGAGTTTGAASVAEQATTKAAPEGQFDAEGFRAWVLRNLPDDTIIGDSAWWAAHLTEWAQRFVKAAPQPADAPLSDDVVKDAERYHRWLRNKSTVLHGTAWLGSATAYQRDVDFLRRDDALAALDAAIYAAIAAQGGKV